LRDVTGFEIVRHFRVRTQQYFDTGKLVVFLASLVDRTDPVSAYVYQRLGMEIMQASADDILLLEAIEDAMANLPRRGRLEIPGEFKLLR
jgi:hypothetical protein